MSPNSECHLGPHQMLATIKQGSNITPDDLIANHDPLIAVAFVLRLVWFVRVVVAGTVSWVPLFSPSAVELYFSMVVGYLVDAITGLDYGGYDAQCWDYALNTMYVVKRRDVCERVVLGWAGRGWLVGKRRESQKSVRAF